MPSNLFGKVSLWMYSSHPYLSTQGSQEDVAFFLMLQFDRQCTFLYCYIIKNVFNLILFKSCVYTCTGMSI